MPRGLFAFLEPLLRLYPEIRRPVFEATGIDPYQRYRQHKASAAARGLTFSFTFVDWWNEWKFKFSERGTHKGQSVMCRTGDKGGYEPGNVRIDTVESNVRERTSVLMRRDFAEAWQQSSASEWLDMRTRCGFAPIDEETEEFED